MITTFDQKLVEQLNGWVIDGWPVGNLILCLIALVLSIILCGLIGLEREWRGRSAGLRTHLLVGLGSCIIMIISIYGFPGIFSEHRDVARLAAQIITGIGFLGAGVIMHRSSGIRGLTTAATIWIVMAIGLACGSFNFILAIIGTLLIFVVLTVFRNVEKGINKINPTIVLCVPPEESALNKILEISNEFEYSIHGLGSELSEINGKEVVRIVFQVVFHSGSERFNEYVSEIEKETHAVSISLHGHR